VEDDQAQRMLVRMPNKFNKLLWVKTGVSRARVARRTSPPLLLGPSLDSLLSPNAPLFLNNTGSYLIANVADAPGGDKVRGEVAAVLYEAHVRQMRKDGNWCVAHRRLRRTGKCMGCMPRARLLALPSKWTHGSPSSTLPTLTCTLGNVARAGRLASLSRQL
jgi:hypothetical protein